MTDDDVERTLRAYRPIDPPAALRARIVAAAGSRDATRVEWRAWSAVAAAIVLTGLFSRLAARERDRLEARFATPAGAAVVMTIDPAPTEEATR